MIFCYFEILSENLNSYLVERDVTQEGVDPHLS